ncbi:MAG TPA: contractile injection system protein, VgrG/Pvc8 family [Thermoanaerobaculia bacterium]|nr:contractile injection system protein, VgrG/Pvc8 family [Thermoanaerobaculia bacterium]
MAGGTERLAPEVRVRINGADLPPKAAADVVSAAVSQDVTAPGMIELRMINRDMNKLQVSWSDDPLFAEGNEIEILMGYAGKLESVLVGEITGLEPEFHAGEVPMLTVRGHDRRHRLMRGRKVRSFTKVKDSDIASQIAQEVGLTAEVENTQTTLDSVLQHNQSDWDFLEARARRLGYEVVVEGKTLRFRPHKNDGSEVVTLARDAELIEFYPRLSTLGLVGEVVVQGWSPKDKEAIQGKAAAGSEGTTMGGSTGGPAAADKAFTAAVGTVVNRPVFSQAEADEIALGRLKEMALSYITGEAVTVGRTDLKAGTVIKIEGFGRRFSGLYYVASARHTYNTTRGYRTELGLRRNAT